MITVWFYHPTDGICMEYRNSVAKLIVNGVVRVILTEDMGMGYATVESVSFTLQRNLRLNGDVEVLIERRSPSGSTEWYTPSIGISHNTTIEAL